MVIKEYVGYIRLWQAVILQALKDLKKSNISELDHRRAKNFFNLENKTYIETCLYAGWCPVQIYNKAERYLNNGTVKDFYKHRRGSRIG